VIVVRLDVICLRLDALVRHTHAENYSMAAPFPMCYNKVNHPSARSFDRRTIRLSDYETPQSPEPRPRD
jgi:hypothetical protein